MVDIVRGVINDFNPTFYPVVGATLVVLVTATFVLRFGYRPPPKMGWVDAFYFTIETMTTTGYGDFSFVNQPTWLRTFSTLLMFSGVTTTALLVSFVADVLLSRRFVFASARPRVGHLRNHTVVVGLSGLGMRVVQDLTAAVAAFPAPATLADKNQLLGFLNGELVGDPASIPLNAHDQIVIWYGPKSAGNPTLPATTTFPPGL